MEEIQNHPYSPFIPETTKALILGSAPPSRFCSRLKTEPQDKDIDYYYGSYSRGYNLLWELLFQIFEPESLTDLKRICNLQNPREERTLIQQKFFQNFLLQHQLGIADILYQFIRRDQSSADNKLHPLKFLALTDFIDSAPKLQTVFCTSHYKVFIWLKQYLNNQDIYLKKEAEDFSFLLPNRDNQSSPLRRIFVRILPSPSPIGRLHYPDHKSFFENILKLYAELFKDIMLPE